MRWYFVILHLELLNYELARHRIALSEHVQYAMFIAFQWNCFNLVYTCNIALFLFLKCGVTKFRIPPPPLSHNATLRRPPPLLTCDVIYGWPLNRYDYAGMTSSMCLEMMFHVCDLWTLVNSRLVDHTGTYGSHIRKCVEKSQSSADIHIIPIHLHKRIEYEVAPLHRLDPRLNSSRASLSQPYDRFTVGCSQIRFDYNYNSNKPSVYEGKV